MGICIGRSLIRAKYGQYEGLIVGYSICILVPAMLFVGPEVTAIVTVFVPPTKVRLHF